MRRIAFAGASGTGKTVLAKHIESALDIPFNPIGSRNVAKMMGFDNPYDVDRAGKRAEFQRELIVQKMAWEGITESFVSDRTPCDNLAYTMLHDVRCVTPEMLDQVRAGMARYTHVILCPMSGFFSLAGDPVRVPDRTYHEMYEVVVDALIERFLGSNTKVMRCYLSGLENRKDIVAKFVA